MDVPTLASATGSAQPPATSAAVPAAVAPHANESDPRVLGERVPQQPGISPAIAKIFGGGDGETKATPLSVSYTIVNHQIHTVFTDPDTGQEIAQFPPDLLAHMAVFFDQVSGVTLDQNA